MACGADSFMRSLLDRELLSYEHVSCDEVGTKVDFSVFSEIWSRSYVPEGFIHYTHVVPVKG